MHHQNQSLGILLLTQDLEATLEVIESSFDFEASNQIQFFIHSSQDMFSKELKQKLKLLPSKLNIYQDNEPHSTSTLFNALVTHAKMNGCEYVLLITDEQLLAYFKLLPAYPITDISYYISTDSPWFTHLLFGLGRFLHFKPLQLTFPIVGVILPTKTFLSLGGLDDSLYRELELTDLLLNANHRNHSLTPIKTPLKVTQPSLTPLFWLFRIKNHWIVLSRYFSLVKVCWWMSVVGIKLLIACISNRKGADLPLIIQGYLDGIKIVLIRK